MNWRKCRFTVVSRTVECYVVGSRLLMNFVNIERTWQFLMVQGQGASTRRIVCGNNCNVFSARRGHHHLINNSSLQTRVHRYSSAQPVYITVSQFLTLSSTVVTIRTSCFNTRNFCTVSTHLTNVSLKIFTQGPEGSRRLRLRAFKTIGTWRWWGCQPYAPADSQEIFLVLITVSGRVEPRDIVRQ
jgi:hypothetical protein